MKCEFCTFKSSNKRQFKRHSRVHRNRASEESKARVSSEPVEVPVVPVKVEASTQTEAPRPREPRPEARRQPRQDTWIRRPRWRPATGPSETPHPEIESIIVAKARIADPLDEDPLCLLTS